jgi:hypothetical protein
MEEKDNISGVDKNKRARARISIVIQKNMSMKEY